MLIVLNYVLQSNLGLKSWNLSLSNNMTHLVHFLKMVKNPNLYMKNLGWIITIKQKVLGRSTMILKRSKNIHWYYEEPKITEYELLTKYSPMMINSKIRVIQEQIDAMYHLNTSHMCCDEVEGVITVSYPLEKLVFWI